MRILVVKSLLFVFVLACSPVWSQNNGNGNGNGNNGNVGGIRIDASGVVLVVAPAKESVAATKKRQLAFATENLPAELAKSSNQRRVSLVELDRAIAANSLTTDLKHLGGLTRIDYLVVDRAAKEIAIVGPAEGFGPDAQGRMRGLSSGRPVLQLDDLLVAWRTVAQGTTTVTCSIDPTQEGIAAFRAFTQQNQIAQPNQVGRLFDAMAEALGQQTIRVSGVPDDSHFAFVLVEADLKMKRIALGKDPSQVRGVSSQLALMRAGDNSMSRWWFVPLYDPIEVTADRSMFRLSGQRLQLLAQDEFTSAQGDRAAAPSNKLATDKFARQFTDEVEALAKAHPVLAELQNLFDLLVICTLIEKSQLSRAIDWHPTALGVENRQLSPVYPVAKHVPAVAATHRVSRTVVGLVGGVELRAEAVAQNTAEWKSEAPSLPASKPGSYWADKEHDGPGDR